MAMRRRRSPPPPSPRARARACACARATTRPELGRSGGGGGAAQCNATTAAAWCPRHHTHAAALGCLARAPSRSTVFAHGRRRDERHTTAAARGVMAGARCQTGGARARAAPACPWGVAFPPGGLLWCVFSRPSCERALARALLRPPPSRFKPIPVYANGFQNRRRARRAPCRDGRRAGRGRRPAAALLVLVERTVENARRRQHSRVVCVRNPADCEVKSGALLRWRFPQALAMSHLRGFGFARGHNHQKRHFRSKVSHLSCIARAPGAPPSEMRPA